MRYTTLDSIVRGVLLQKRWPIHFYVECLVYAQRCLEEIQFDSIGVVRTKEIKLNSYNAGELPCDYQDFCKIGIPIGQYIKPLSAREGITRLNNFDKNTGNKILFPNEETYVQALPGLNNVTWLNDNMEFFGRNYGSAGNQSGTYKIVPERNEIQMDGNLAAMSIVMEYISDGSECDNATRVNPYAKSTIEAFIDWKYKENGRSHSDFERDRARRQFEHQNDILRARANPLTLTDIKQMFRRHAHGSIKG